MVKLPIPLSFEWDQGNIEKNWKKHKVSNKESEEIFFNKPIKIFKDVKHSQTENRFVVLGKTNKNRKLYVAFAIPDRNIRIISARDQSKKERKMYEKES